MPSAFFGGAEAGEIEGTDEPESRSVSTSPGVPSSATKSIGISLSSVNLCKPDSGSSWRELLILERVETGTFSLDRRSKLFFSALTFSRSAAISARRVADLDSLSFGSERMASSASPITSGRSRRRPPTYFSFSSFSPFSFFLNPKNDLRPLDFFFSLVSFSVPALAESDASVELPVGRAGASSNAISSTRDGAASNACIPASVEGSVVKDEMRPE
mmetsp:Transcript_74212/g.108845  ORF Transcript_74212/g.108845 Transcript_74212/m.108845 type:complete len:216 (-) Transcript_74212:392-1039(-)